MFPLSIQNQRMWCNSQTQHCLIWTAVQKRCTSNIEESFYRQWKGRLKVQTLHSGHCQVCSVYPYACCLSGKYSLRPGQFPIFLWSCIFLPVTVILPCQFLGLWHCLICRSLVLFWKCPKKERERGEREREREYKNKTKYKIIKWSGHAMDRQLLNHLNFFNKSIFPWPNLHSASGSVRICHVMNTIMLLWRSRHILWSSCQNVAALMFEDGQARKFTFLC